ncbi:hypothetical protein ABBQ38_014053 [Trebouxia sp. C0009 RCD-2024]
MDNHSNPCGVMFWARANGFATISVQAVTSGTIANSLMQNVSGQQYTGLLLCRAPSADIRIHLTCLIGFFCVVTDSCQVSLGLCQSCHTSHTDLCNACFAEALWR